MATVEEGGRVVIKLDSKSPKEHIILDKDYNLVAKVSKLPKGIQRALGPSAEEILTDNEASLTSQREIEQQLLDKNNELAEARHVRATLQRRLDLAIKELADTRRNAAVKEAHYRNVIDRNTQLEIDLRNAGENQRQELNRQLAEGRVEREQLQRDRHAANARRTAAEREVENLRRNEARR